ncbi:hypothetical protein [Providencia rettgeri]|uniref:hypothetical protein n=1 Tax=Providencia rettgeri TaxID=587 RepID=UPI0034E05C07
MPIHLPFHSKNCHPTKKHRDLLQDYAQAKFSQQENTIIKKLAEIPMIKIANQTYTLHRPFIAKPLKLTVHEVQWLAQINSVSADKSAIK